MSTNILIGVGGTGAKVVEAALHATAAGLGAESLLVGFVDQDQANGNVHRARQLLATLADAHDLWRGGNARHHLGKDSGLLQAAIAPIAGNGGEVWIPHRGGESVTLSKIFGRGAMADEDRDLFDLMFHAGETEQDMSLGEGYRGRPHLGAAAMASEVDSDTEFWKALLQQIRQAQGGAEVRLMLTGSVFGGTGAAGFPTLARLIRRRLADAQITRNVKIGGTLMLPYFGFDGPSEEEGLEGNVARAEQLLLQSREAVKYYHDLFAHERVFEELYFVGWDPVFHFPYHSPGSLEQANPALLPEFIAAMGVCRFFNREHTIDETLSNPVFVSARQDAKAFTWSDVPSPVDNQKDAPYHQFGQLLRFAAAWSHWRGVLGEKRNSLARFLPSDPWYKAQGVNLVDFKREPPNDEINKLSEYLDALLTWAASIDFYCAEARIRLDLWRTNAVVGEINKAKPNETLIRLKGALGEDDYAKAYNAMVVKKNASEPLTDANAMTVRLNEAPFGSGDYRGLGRMVGALYAYSAVAA